jgi:hypothetical protein
VLLLFVLSPGINWRWLLFGVIAGFSLYLPYLIGEMHHGWSNTQKLFSEDTGFSWGWLKILTSPAALLASVPGSVAPDDTSTFKELGDRFFGSYFIFFAISVLSLLLALALYFSYLKVFSGAMLAVVKRRHEAIAKHRATLFIGGLIFLPLVLFALTGHSYTSRYAMLIMPLLFLLPAIMVKRSSDAGLKQWFFLAVAALVIYNSYLAVVTYHYKAQLLTDSSYVMPSFKKLESMSAAVNSDAGEQARARLQLSMSIRALTGRYDKIYSVYPEYVVTEQRYKYEKSDSLPVMDYLVQLPQEVLQPGSKLIYRDNNVVITTSALSHN